MRAMLMSAPHPGSRRLGSLALTRDRPRPVQEEDPHPGRRRGRHEELTTLAHRGGVQYSDEFTLPGNTPDLLRRIPEDVWAPAYDADGMVRPGAGGRGHRTGDADGVATGYAGSSPAASDPPGAQLRFEDVDGMLLVEFATNTTAAQLPDRAVPGWQPLSGVRCALLRSGPVSDQPPRTVGVSH